ncbi:hypothetical protein BDA99DRAFT_573513 [Phascolomyces articulosus]|uniref:F-box domain-containing protein n=1 Tax=Phascolomyces articulosus TaxID=60185 RepID=A0AAD5PDM9_9FUNG|nr:hypothetical protein BDA99DRAFT_573513 [Phascolomyces articulosus]
MHTMTILPYFNDKDLPLQSLENLWQKLNTACDTNNANDEINILNTAEQQVEQNILTTILLKRAHVYISQDRIQEGIDDLNKVMKLAPAAIESYFHLGNLFSAMGKRAEARRIYLKAVKAVDVTLSSPDSPKWKMYQALVSSMNSLEEEIERTNTTLLKLPLELLDTIFMDLMRVEDRYQCMWTCHAWKRLLLDILPSIRKRHVMISNMSKQEMARLLASVSQNKAFGPLAGSKQSTRQLKISILPRTSNKALQTALILLMKKEWNNQVWRLDILSGLDHPSLFTKESIRMLQVQNKLSLRTLTLCTYKDTGATVDALEKNPKLQQLIAAAHHTLLDDMPQCTFSGRKLGDDRTWETEVEYGRDMILANARKMQFKTLFSASNPSTAAEQFLRQEYAQRLASNFPRNAAHRELKKLVLIAMEVSYFRNPIFWKRLPNLEHVVIKNPVGLDSDFIQIAQNIHLHCRKLKTFRYGEGWDSHAISDDCVVTTATTSSPPTTTAATDTSTKEGEEADQSQQQQQQQRPQQEQQQQLQQQQQQIKSHVLNELIVRTPYGTNINTENGTTLISDMLIANGTTLRILVLQLDLLENDNSSMAMLVDKALPCLKELQLHDRPNSVSQSVFITDTHMVALAKNFPALEKIVFNGIRMTTNGILGLRHMDRRLRCIHLKLSDLNTILGHSSIYRSRAFLNRRNNNNNVDNNHNNHNDGNNNNVENSNGVENNDDENNNNGENIANDDENNNNNDDNIANDDENNNNDLSDGSSDDLSDDEDRYIISKNALSSGIQNSMAMVSEACFSGHQVTIQDVLTLTTYNHSHLTTLRLVGCGSIKDDSLLISALSHANYLRYITFAHLPKLEAATIASLTIELMGYLEELVVIECESISPHHHTIIPEQVIKMDQQDTVVVPRRKTFSVLKLCFVHNLAIPETHLIEYYTQHEQQYPPQLQLMTPKILTKADISIVKPILHFL